jgi:hypothetical protein
MSVRAPIPSVATVLYLAVRELNVEPMQAGANSRVGDQRRDARDVPC